MKKLIHVKKHLRKGKIVKSHTRRASKELKNKLARRADKDLGQLDVGRANLRRKTRAEVYGFKGPGNSRVLAGTQTLNQKINRKGQQEVAHKNNAKFFTKNQLGARKMQRRKLK